MLIIAVRVIGWAGNFPGSRLEGEGGECGVMVMHRWPCPSMTGHLQCDRNTDRNEGPYFYDGNRLNLWLRVRFEVTRGISSKLQHFCRHNMYMCPSAARSTCVVEGHKIFHRDCDRKRPKTS